jgi:hypothetical protein
LTDEAKGIVQKRQRLRSVVGRQSGSDLAERQRFFVRFGDLPRRLNGFGEQVGHHRFGRSFL